MLVIVAFLPWCEMTGDWTQMPSYAAQMKYFPNASEYAQKRK